MVRTVLAAILGAAVVGGVVAMAGDGGRPAPLRAAGMPDTSGGLIALPTTAADGRQSLTIIDPRVRVMAVYQIDAAKGEITLKGVRNIHWDLQIDEFNGTNPLPADIRALVEQR